MNANRELPEGVSPEDRPDWALEAELKRLGLIDFSTRLAMEGAMLQAGELLHREIMDEVTASLNRGEKPLTADGVSTWLRWIIEAKLRNFDRRLVDAGLPPSAPLDEM